MVSSPTLITIPINPVNESAPIRATAAYIMLFTNLVEGLVMEEKNIALRDAFESLVFISLNLDTLYSDGGKCGSIFN